MVGSGGREHAPARGRNGPATPGVQDHEVELEVLGKPERTVITTYVPRGFFARVTWRR